MTKEIRIGALAVIAIIGLIWGYKFVKGENLFSSSTTLLTKFDDVTLLSVSSPVFIRGLKVGTVTNIRLDEEDLTKMIVEFAIEGDYKIPKNAVVFMKSEGLVGGNVLAIDFDNLCTGPDCVEDRDFIKSKTFGIISSLVGEEEMENIAGTLKESVQGVMSELGNPNSDAALDKTIRDLSTTMDNLAKMTAQTNKLLVNTNASITKTMSNMSKITSNLVENNDKITSILTNLNETTRQLNAAGVDKLVDNTNVTIAQAATTLKGLDATLAKANTSFTELSDILNTVKNGDGSLTQLMNDKQLYNNLESTSKNMSLLLQDLRLNPSRYVKVSVFGGKNKDEYVKPANDPAFKEN